MRRILRRLSGEVGRWARHIDAAVDVIGQLDLITAKARYSRDYDMFAPDVNTEGRLWLRPARHPLLEHLFRNEPGVRSQESADRGQESGVSERLWPNGKSCRSTSGSARVQPAGHHRAEHRRQDGHAEDDRPALPDGPVRDAHPRGRGEHGSGLRTSWPTSATSRAWSSRSARSARTSRGSRPSSRPPTHKSLVLLDELGAGTDPTEGAALGRAILDQLDKVGCRAIVTTHLGDLKTYAFTNDRAENGAVEFDVETLRPTYRLHIGQFGMSNALKIARRLKLPKELLKRAHKYAKRRKGKTGELARLQQLREEAEKARTEALARQHEADRQRRSSSDAWPSWKSARPRTRS